MACSVTPDEYMSRLLMPKICPMAHSRNTPPNHDPLLGRIARAVAGVVVPVLRPAQPAESDGEGQRLQEPLPVAAGLHEVEVGVRDGESEEDGEQDDEGDHQ